ncbi:uncharacterized protein LOC114828557 [Galendromus occidentalis]|uniref:Uncharacterized protein LOC114828557 n=1 Tax=Galendromus occidentalis TaxID=34638 RepID=A0AAJ7SI76_9ACAR|nr:uncharacterized protein LOC114828557 [Galendromus occidentalis]
MRGYTESRILFDSLPNNFKEITIQTKILVGKGVAYCNADPDECALRKAAVWGKESAVELFLTGDQHTPEEAANAYELLQIGTMRPEVMDIPLGIEGLKYFRRAQRVRDEANIKARQLAVNRKCFESIEDIIELENLVNDRKALEFVQQCYAICVAHKFPNLPFSDPLGIYDLQTWMFYYLESYRDVICLFLSIELEDRRFFHNKYRSAIARLLLESSPPDWTEIVMIFHTLSYMGYQSNTAIEIFRGIDLDQLKVTLESADFPRNGCSLLLSYIADVMQSTVLEVLLEYVELLLTLGAEVSLTSREHRAIEEQMASCAGKKMWWLPPDETGYVKSEDAFDPTTLHRLLAACSMWQQSHRFKLTIESVLNAACCPMDAQNFSRVKNRNFGVLRLKCLAAKKCSRAVCAMLPVTLVHFVRKHR